jgi:uncharacterized protein (TIGR00645 family)
VATAIVDISSIHLLQLFMRVEDYDDQTIQWRVVIHVVFLVGAVLLGILDRIGSHHGSALRNEKV